MMDKYERKVAEYTDWSLVKQCCEEIRKDIEKMLHRKTERTGEIRWSMEQIERLFWKAKDRAFKEIRGEKEVIHR
jgi:hypothetical protein